MSERANTLTGYTTTDVYVAGEGLITQGTLVEVTETRSGHYRIRGRSTDGQIVRTRRLTAAEMHARVEPA